MVPQDKTLKESAESLKLKTDRLVENSRYTLKEDLWSKGALLLRSGAYITDEVLNKLLNFGVKEVEVSPDEYVEENEEDIEINEYSIKQFLVTQNVLIVEKNLLNASLIAKSLIDRGYKEGNIFVTKEPCAINGYFRAKKFNFLFIDNELYEKSRKCVDKFSLLRNTHVFVVTDTDNVVGLNLLKTVRIKYLYRKAIEEKINKYVLHALHQNYLDFWNNEEEEEKEALIS